MTENKSHHTTRTLRGTVVSDKMQGTVVVRVEDYVKHPSYGKYVKRQKRYAVDNPGGRYAVGDSVTIVSSRPLSKTKHFRIVEHGTNTRMKNE